VVGVYIAKVNAGKVKTQDVIGRGRQKDKDFLVVVSADDIEDAESKALKLLLSQEKITQETIDKILNNTTLSEDGESRVMNKNYFDNYDIHVSPEEVGEGTIVWESDEF
jgi:nitrogen regulatory protein PII